MKNFLSNLKIPAIVSLLLVAPFMLMEFVNRRQFHEGYPFLLFFVLWILPFIFIAIVMPLARDARAGMDILARPLSLGVKVAFMLLIALLWFSLVADQMPCFMGVPMCD
jgi:hypothetical protein